MIAKARVLLTLLVCAICISAALPNPTRADSQVQALPVVPSPEGFIEGSALSADIKKLGLAGQSPSGKLIGVYYQPDTLAKILKQGYYTEPAPFCQAQVQREFNSAEEARQNFKDLVTNAKKESTTKFDRNDPAIDRIWKHYEDAANNLARDEALSVNGATALGDLAETDTFYANSSIISYSLSDKQHTSTLPVASAFGWILIGRRILGISAIYPLVDKQSITVANDTLMTWLKDIVKHNESTL